MTRRRVVVTGLGCVSPVGNTVDEAWANLLAGRSGIDLVTKFDASSFACKIAGEVKNFPLESYINSKDARTMDTFIHYGIAAAAQAVADAGLKVGDALDGDAAERIGCVIGSGIGGLPMIEQTHTELTNRGPRRISPFFIPASIINLGSRQGIYGQPGDGIYGAGKEAIRAMTRTAGLAAVTVLPVVLLMPHVVALTIGLFLVGFGRTLQLTSVRVIGAVSSVAVLVVPFVATGDARVAWTSVAMVGALTASAIVCARATK